MINSKLIQNIESYNNTRCYEMGGDIFIDSMKYPHVFAKLGKELGFKIKILNEPTNDMVLFGEESSGFNHQGQEFACFAMKVEK